MRKPLVTPYPAGPYTAYRLFEWCMAIMMILIAFTLALPGDTMERAALRPAAALGFTEANLATIFGPVGAVRCLALYLNGQINNLVTGPRGAIIRACCAALGCFVIGQLAGSLIFDALFLSESTSFFLPVLGTLACFELLSVYIAMLDAVERRDRLGKALDELERASR